MWPWPPDTLECLCCSASPPPPLLSLPLWWQQQQDPRLSRRIARLQALLADVDARLAATPAAHASSRLSPPAGKLGRQLSAGGSEAEAAAAQRRARREAALRAGAPSLEEHAAAEGVPAASLRAALRREGLSFPEFYAAQQLAREEAQEPDADAQQQQHDHELPGEEEDAAGGGVQAAAADGPLTLEEFAASLGISAARFRRALEREGLTFEAWLEKTTAAAASPS